MTWDILSHVGVGAVRFGQTREIVRRFFKEKPTEFFKAPDDPVKTDYFESDGVFIFYNANDTCEAVEFCKPAIVTWQNKQLLPLPLGELLDYMRSQDNNLDEEDTVSGFLSYKNGIGGYIEDIEELEEPAETIICFRRGYYDELA
jgi:hypothetical protein